MNTASTLVIPDTHVPFHDRKAWALVLRVIREMQPDRIVLLGDFADCLAVSHFPKTPSRAAGLGAEIASVNVELDALSEAAGKASVVFLSGNHEWRLERYLTQKAPELFDVLEISSLLNVAKRGWRWVPYKQHITIGKVAYAHDIGYSGKSAVQQSLSSFGGNIIFGHTHRSGIVYGGTVKREHRVAMSCGWLGDVSEIDYMHQSQTKDWQTGFGWVQQAKNGDSWLQFVPIIAGRCCVEGYWIGGKV